MEIQLLMVQLNFIAQAAGRSSSLDCCFVQISKEQLLGPNLQHQQTQLTVAGEV